MPEELATSSETATLGWRVRKRAIAPGSRFVEKAGRQASFRSPDPWSRIRAAALRNRASPAKVSCTSRKKSWPSAVGTRRPFSRSNRRNPMARSSAMTALLTAGCEMRSTSAAREVVP